MEAPSADLPRLAKHFFSLSPSTPTLIPSLPFPSPQTLCLAEVQDWIVEYLISNAEVYAGGESWRKVFWRRIVDGIEAGFEARKENGEDVSDEEVHPSIYDALLLFLSASSGPPATCLKRYYWGPLMKREGWNSIVTSEDGKMISGGTTGLRTWGACIALCNHLIRDPSILDDSPILELGSGTGLLSLIAGRLSSATRIVATDVDESVLRQLQENVDMNQLGHQVTVAKLDWEDASETSSHPELIQWEEETLAESRPRLILGADIVFDPSLATHLASMLSFLLRYDKSSNSSAPPMQALISATIRNRSTWDGFVANVEALGLKTEQVELLDAGFDGLVGAEGWEGEGEIILVRISRSL